MKVLASLKIDKLLLDEGINGKTQIFANVQAIAVQQANRTYALIGCLSECKNKRKVIQIIQRINFTIIRKIEKLTKFGIVFVDCYF